MSYVSDNFEVLRGTDEGGDRYNYINHTKNGRVLRSFSKHIKNARVLRFKKIMNRPVNVPVARFPVCRKPHDTMPHS